MLHPKMKHVYVGVDIHRQTHTAVIINCFGEKLGEITFENKPAEFEKLLRAVRKHTPKGISGIYGLEDVCSSGRALAVFLINKKRMVKHVNPSLTYSERRNQTILHKTDDYDALCVARVLLSRLSELPDANPQDIYWTMSQLVGRRSAIIKANVALKNQLHAYIIHHYPSYKKFFFLIACKTALAFWENYPSPSKLEGVGVEELGAFLYEKSHWMYSKGKAEEILFYVAKDGNTTTDYQDFRDFMVSSTVRQLKHNKNELLEVEKKIKEMLPLFGQKLESLNGVNHITAASLIAQIGDINRFSSADKLAKYAGISPIQYSSGKTDKVLCNILGDRNLNRIFFMLAITITGRAGKNNPINKTFYDYYNKKIKEGKTKKQALKCVMRRLVNIIYSMMKNKSEYIPKNDTK